MGHVFVVSLLTIALGRSQGEGQQSVCRLQLESDDNLSTQYDYWHQNPNC